jgi:hypothetical protein
VSLSSLDIAILAGKEELRTEFFNEMRTWFKKREVIDFIISLIVAVVSKCICLY